MMKRLLRYLIPVLSMSIMLNASKFFEAYLYYDGKEYSIRLSSFRRNLTYSGIVNWVRFLMMGVIPLSAIIYLYLKIYKDIKERQRTMFLRNCAHQINSSLPSQNVSSQHTYSFMSLLMNYLLKTVKGHFTKFYCNKGCELQNFPGIIQ